MVRFRTVAVGDFERVEFFEHAPDIPVEVFAHREGGAEVLPETQDEEYGRFGWFIDPEGNKIELWQPAAPRRS